MEGVIRHQLHLALSAKADRILGPIMGLVVMISLLYFSCSRHDVCVLHMHSAGSDHLHLLHQILLDSARHVLLTRSCLSTGCCLESSTAPPKVEALSASSFLPPPLSTLTLLVSWNATDTHMQRMMQGIGRVARDMADKRHGRGRPGLCTVTVCALFMRLRIATPGRIVVTVSSHAFGKAGHVLVEDKVRLMAPTCVSTWQCCAKRWSRVSAMCAASLLKSPATHMSDSDISVMDELLQNFKFRQCCCAMSSRRTSSRDPGGRAGGHVLSADGGRLTAAAAARSQPLQPELRL